MADPRRCPSAGGVPGLRGGQATTAQDRQVTRLQRSVSSGSSDMTWCWLRCCRSPATIRSVTRRQSMISPICSSGTPRMWYIAEGSKTFSPSSRRWSFQRWKTVCGSALCSSRRKLVPLWLFDRKKAASVAAPMAMWLGCPKIPSGPKVATTVGCSSSRIWPTAFWSAGRAGPGRRRHRGIRATHGDPATDRPLARRPRPPACGFARATLGWRESPEDISRPAVGGVDQDEAETGVIGMQRHSSSRPVGVVVGMCNNHRKLRPSDVTESILPDARGRRRSGRDPA